MDPEITLAEINKALDAGDLDTAREYWEYLQEWISKGGFIPTGYLTVQERMFHNLVSEDN